MISNFIVTENGKISKVKRRTTTNFSQFLIKSAAIKPYILYYTATTGCFKFLVILKQRFPELSELYLFQLIIELLLLATSFENLKIDPLTVEI